MTRFKLPSKSNFDSLDRDNRMNIFRKFFASSRYDRLLIQHTLVKSVLDKSLSSSIETLEKEHLDNFINFVNAITEYGYYDEFFEAVREEDIALEKIIEAYDMRMNNRFQDRKS